MIVLSVKCFIVFIGIVANVSTIPSKRITNFNHKEKHPGNIDYYVFSFSKYNLLFHNLLSPEYCPIIVQVEDMKLQDDKELVFLRHFNNWCLHS